MKVKRIISESKDGNRREVIGKDDSTQRTLHICREHNVWRYFVGCNREGRKVFLPITI